MVNADHGGIAFPITTCAAAIREAPGWTLVPNTEPGPAGEQVLLALRPGKEAEATPRNAPCLRAAHAAPAGAGRHAVRGANGAGRSAPQPAAPSRRSPRACTSSSFAPPRHPRAAAADITAGPLPDRQACAPFRAGLGLFQGSAHRGRMTVPFSEGGGGAASHRVGPATVSQGGRATRPCPSFRPRR